ncbi:hypothetical protein O6H91_01G093300 [Diphasiastrum complanatum]|uniref:Uncharacterized protein n=1 Tax=Diphasiastrum complanatum TaxID=34168 RepID=A0ACC2ETM1_DIPCM|nr:hypothetical protein O6H91_01G093300 [Diphasiastrum complanatum]
MASMWSYCWLSIAVVFLISVTTDAGRVLSQNEWQDGKLIMRTEDFLNQKDGVEGTAIKGTRWAVLIAGSAGYYNYRHQADVCHAYQLLRQGGLKEENIVVFMYDDIAFYPYNPLPGKIINNPDGVDVYKGVPKDYTKSEVTVDNFFAVLLGNRTALSGGSGKVVDSGPNDHIFIFYTDHGGPGILGIPNTPYLLYADDFVNTLKKKHASGTYRKMVIYVEACESGSIFEGLLPQGMNIYVTTASNARESSWATYCPGSYPSPPLGFDVCIGDLYSVSWMEDSEVHNLQRETLLDQYLTVKQRTSVKNTYQLGSHVMQYGDTLIDKEPISLYQGFNPANADLPAVSAKSLDKFKPGLELFLAGKHPFGVHQRDTDLLHLWHKYANAPEASEKKAEAQKELMKVLARREHIDRSVNLIGDILFGSEVGSTILTAVRPAGQALVDDWSCLKSMVPAFEGKCGLLTEYGMKHTRAFANMCNAGKDASAVASAAGEACSLSSYSLSDVWAPATDKFSP